jgi:tetratricopeptide (TPR) repeat protein
MYQFHKYLKLAKADLEKSSQMNPDDPNSWSNLILVAQGLKYSYTQMDYYFKRAIKACPGHYGAYWYKGCYLKPRWYGSWPALYDFAKESLELSSQFVFLGGLMLNYYTEFAERALEDKTFLSNEEVWNRINKIFDNFFAKYPDDLQWHFYYARLAYRAKKYDIAIEQFNRIGDTWLIQNCWDSLKLYNSCRAYAYFQHAAKEPPEESLRCLKKAASLDPYRSDYLYKLGLVSMGLGLYDEAEESFLRAIDIDSCFVPSQLQLSYLYGKFKDDRKKAREFAANVLRCDTSEEQYFLAREYMEGNFLTEYGAQHVVKKESWWKKIYDFWGYFFTMRSSR